MHDIDRTNHEWSPEFGSELQEGSFEAAFEGLPIAEEGNFGEVGPGEASFESPFGEVEELALAAELLSVNNEEELDLFLGSLISKVGKGIKSFANSSVGKAIGGALRTVAKTALPIAGTALGSFVGGPLGGMIGGKLGSVAGNLLEIDLEGLEMGELMELSTEGVGWSEMSQEDREYEVARRFVRMAGAATAGALRGRGRGWGNPRSAARRAIYGASRRHAPWLMAPWRGGGARRSAYGGNRGYQGGNRAYGGRRSYSGTRTYAGNQAYGGNRGYYGGNQAYGQSGGDGGGGSGYGGGTGGWRHRRRVDPSAGDDGPVSWGSRRPYVFQPRVPYAVPGLIVEPPPAPPDDGPPVDAGPAVVPVDVAVPAPDAGTDAADGGGDPGDGGSGELAGFAGPGGSHHASRHRWPAAGNWHRQNGSIVLNFE